MKPVVFSNENIRTFSRKSSGYWITVNPINGDILFSPDFSQLIDGHKILFIQDEESPQNWYIQITDAENGIPVRQEKQRRYKRLQSNGLTDLLLGTSRKMDSMQLLQNQPCKLEKPLKIKPWNVSASVRK